MHGLGAVPQRQPTRLAGAIDLLRDQVGDDTAGDVVLHICFERLLPFARQVAALSGAIDTPLAIRAGITHRLIEQLAGAITSVGEYRSATPRGQPYCHWLGCLPRASVWREHRQSRPLWCGQSLKAYWIFHPR